MHRIPYSRVPDFTKPLLEIPAEVKSKMRSRLSFLYGDSKAEEWLPELERIMKVHHAHKPQELIDKEKGHYAAERFTERDMVLITCGDAIKGDHGTTLAALHKVVHLNHCSSRSVMFREFLKGTPFCRDFFIAYDSPDDFTRDQRSKIFRPRTSDILTRFDTINGPKHVWTTFSDDQIDLNFRNPRVLLFMIKALLF